MSSDNSEEQDKALRQEIIESQKTQADYLKWKLISVATVASISLGFGPTNTTSVKGAKLLLCLIPLICAYIDLISIHIMIRIITIGVYLKVSGSPYEKFVFKIRDKASVNPFVFEASALHGSSLVFNVILILLGFSLPLSDWPQQYLTAYIVAGSLGIVATLFSWLLYTVRARDVIRISETGID